MSLETNGKLPEFLSCTGRALVSCGFVQNRCRGRHGHNLSDRTDFQFKINTERLCGNHWDARPLRFTESRLADGYRIDADRQETNTVLARPTGVCLLLKISLLIDRQHFRVGNRRSTCVAHCSVDITDVRL